ncbi:uncharacterized protein LOC144581599 [Callithrix jacchus]
MPHSILDFVPHLLSTVHNSKDLEPTRIPINDRLNEENVARIHHGLLCSHTKGYWGAGGVWLHKRGLDKMRVQQTKVHRSKSAWCLFLYPCKVSVFNLEQWKIPSDTV